MKALTAACALALLPSLSGLSLAESEPRTFTNTEGQSIQARLVAVEYEKAVLRLKSRKIARVPLGELSETDREFVNSWWKENENQLDPMDFVLKVTRDVDMLDLDVNTSVAGGGGGGRRGGGCRSCGPPRGGGGGQVIVTKERKRSDELFYRCQLENFTPRQLKEIQVNYTIYKRIRTRGADGSESRTEEIEGSHTIPELARLGTATFDTQPVLCEDESKSGGRGPRTSKRETLEGVILTFSYQGKEFLRQSYPENLLEKVERENGGPSHY
jgi:hypothetical protein